MPFDSEGIFTRIHNWEDDRINDIDIVTDHHDAEDDNFAEALSQTFLRDGRSPMKGDINAAGFQVKNLGDGTSSADAVNLHQLNKSISELQQNLLSVYNNSFIVGDIKASTHAENHGNWFLCNGQAISRTEFSQLFAIIGINFGAGDGTTTFNLPDYRGKFLRGLGGNSASDIYTTQTESLPDINGNISGGVDDNATGNGAFARTGTDTSSRKVDAVGDSNAYAGLFNFSASRSNPIYKGTHVTPINQAINYFIKVKEEN